MAYTKEDENNLRVLSALQVTFLKNLAIIKKYWTNLLLVLISMPPFLIFSNGEIQINKQPANQQLFLKLRPFEFLAAYDIVVWGLKMNTGGVFMTNNVPRVYILGTHTMPSHAITEFKRSKL